MATISSPLTTAHQHAANADDFTMRGLLIPAAEAHYEAAQAFLTCIEQSNDENAKRTLRMLYNDHCKAGKETQRKIAKLREEGKDPALPQKSSPPRNPVLSIPRSTASPPPNAQGRLSDSQNTGDESFMLLGQRSDPGDAFNQFWKIMEGMLDNLSQPVAFATAPLGPAASTTLQRKTIGRNESFSSDTDLEDGIGTRLSRRFGLGKSVRGVGRDGSPAAANPGITKFPPRAHVETPVVDLRDDLEEVHADDWDLTESFCLIPSSSSEPPISVLKKENASLKAEIEGMQQRLAATEKMLKIRCEQDQHLRDSILLARKEAQRAMGASTIMQRTGQIATDLSALNINIPPVPPPVAALNAGRDREAQLVRRVRELEEDVRVLRVDNEKQKAMIVRFRERWEKLKESAKKKKSAKAAAEAAASPVRERIEEEPEAEAELDEHQSP
ncbi:hypothetical protein JAAARDRAFT_33011 [Jaapia argillacea MUCL 33604]|uniref:MIT domain-containing protein n=1 Tax=Jaapia argillacea MUCL 33604 TaxID=933084 RepID=A0A067PXB9_9AGAM|nr:hypothetical protein JAAARDRAFT_33011 [Jaapia argillacea MUCL 33604]